MCENCGSWLIFTDDTGRTRPFRNSDMEKFDPKTLAHMRHETRFIKKRGRKDG